ncbi:hypothetical protein PCANC_02313 [Puccinia coronata f. sp. avenae]|uniref:P-type ATPase A domain-containing protein n=1 Tax=Puccinia coronata f. sp. avenae TaxID=200324 RepID=A0A2N5VZI0_9BASI|nr:hypothetical protein PCANC_02313 [Puccinia coronata f. sp. avenae]
MREFSSSSLLVVIDLIRRNSPDYSEHELMVYLCDYPPPPEAQDDGSENPKPIQSRGSWKVRHWIALSDEEDCSLDWQDFVGTMALLLINSGILVITERSAGNAVKALMDSLASKAQACRNGQWSEIDLVPGDIVAFKIGDVVPGDCCLYDAVNVSIDQWMVHRKLNSMHLRSLDSLTQPKSHSNKRTFLESKTTDSGKGKGKKRARDDELSHPLAGAHRVKHLNHQRLIPGVKLGGMIIQVGPLELIVFVALPSHLIGHVPITEISCHFTDRLTEMASKMINLMRGVATPSGQKIL